MKKLLLVALVFAVSACTGSRGTIGGQKVCTNDYLFGLSLSEQISPCGK